MKNYLSQIISRNEREAAAILI